MTAPRETERAEALAAELMSHPGYATGERRFPRRLSRDEAADLAAALGTQVDRGCQGRAEAATRQSLPIVCDRGCCGCCEEMIVVYQPEAAAVVRWLMRPENHGARDAFLSAYPAWKTAVGDAATRMSDRIAQGDNAGYLQLHQEQWKKGVLCAFNQQGECTIYPVRPLTCRYAHAVETPSRCSGKNAGGQPAARLQYGPLDEYINGARQVLRAAHHALGEPRNRPAALCELVYRQLDAAMAAAKKRERRG